MYIYSCICTYIRVRVHVCFCPPLSPTFSSTYRYTCTYTYSQTHTYRYTRTCPYIHVHEQTFCVSLSNLHSPQRTCTNIHVYIHTYIHTDICVYVHILTFEYGDIQSISSFAFTDIRVHECTYIRVYVHTFVYMYICSRSSMVIYKVIIMTFEWIYDI